jgi:hypothetical protein
MDDLDFAHLGHRVPGIERETYSKGVRKAIYRDVDGNELGFAGLPG